MTLNLASGRDRTGRILDGRALAAAVGGLDADVVAVQEVDTGQERSHRTDQPVALAAALAATDWRFAATVAGTPGPAGSWSPVDQAVLRGPGGDDPGHRYGIALFCRRAVRRWHVLGLRAGHARLPLPVPHPRTGAPTLCWLPDEPRVAVAAELDGLTVIGTHLSFAPHTAARQLRRIRRWARRFAGPVVLAGDLNLPGPLPALLTGGTRLVTAASFPAHDPRVQLDHVLSFGGLTGRAGGARQLPVSDHLGVAVTVEHAGRLR